jgi:hypothetical protein
MEVPILVEFLSLLAALLVLKVLACTDNEIKWVTVIAAAGAVVLFVRIGWLLIFQNSI